jgi:threonine dehydrogenase-like Zn-dependent dehydrogenase
MKAAAFFGVKDIRIVDIGKPEIGEDGVLLKMRACGICGSDMHVYNTDLLTEDSTKLIEGYRIIGHEYTGEVAEVGTKVKGFKAGDRVASVHNKAGMAEYIEVPGDRLKNLHKIPEGTSFETAATLEPFCNPTHSFHMREPKDGETVAIFGAGVIGLGYLQLVKAYTKAKTIISDVSELRLSVAARIGADHVINAREKDVAKEIKRLTGEHYVRYQKKTAGGCDVVVDCAGLPITLQQSFEVLKIENGTLIIASICEEEISIDPNIIVFKYMSVLGSMGYYDHETVEALNLIGTKKVNRDILVSHKIPLEKAPEGFKIQGNSRESVKVVLTNE